MRQQKWSPSDFWAGGKQIQFWRHRKYSRRIWSEHGCQYSGALWIFFGYHLSVGWGRVFFWVFLDRLSSKKFRIQVLLVAANSTRFSTCSSLADAIDGLTVIILIISVLLFSVVPPLRKKKILCTPPNSSAAMHSHVQNCCVDQCITLTLYS